MPFLTHLGQTPLQVTRLKGLAGDKQLSLFHAHCLEEGELWAPNRKGHRCQWLTEMDTQTGRKEVQSTTCPSAPPEARLDTAKPQSGLCLSAPSKEGLWPACSGTNMQIGSVIHEETTFFKLLKLQYVYLKFCL